MRSWYCPHCSYRGTTSDQVAVLFHRCSNMRATRPRWSTPTRDEETQEWARTLLGAELARSVEAKNPDVLLRPTEGEAE